MVLRLLCKGTRGGTRDWDLRAGVVLGVACLWSARGSRFPWGSVDLAGTQLEGMSARMLSRALVSLRGEMQASSCPGGRLSQPGEHLLWPSQTWVACGATRQPGAPQGAVSPSTHMLCLLRSSRCVPHCPVGHLACWLPLTVSGSVFLCPLPPAVPSCWTTSAASETFFPLSPDFQTARSFLKAMSLVCLWPSNPLVNVQFPLLMWVPDSLRLVLLWVLQPPSKL